MQMKTMGQPREAEIGHQSLHVRRTLDSKQKVANCRNYEGSRVMVLIQTRAVRKPTASS